MNARPFPSLPSIPVVLAFASIYLVWGSTYLVILIGIESIPPFLLAGVRFLVAGALLYGFERLRGTPRPSFAQWRWAALIGGLMMFGGNGLVTWSEQLVPSGLAALLVATIPVWMVALDATIYGRARPSRWVWTGLALAIVGVTVLAEPGGGAMSPVGAAVLLVAAFSWANGSLLNRTADLPPSPWLSAAMQMIAGGIILLIAATATGEWTGLDVAAVTARSLGALAYLIVLGSIVTHTAYVYLLRTQSATAVSTYAFVNPVIALSLGWLAGETLGPRALAGALLIVGAVLLIHWARHRPATVAAPPPAVRVRDHACEQRVA